jgi:ketosteroid isomerase-like protein
MWGVHPASAWDVSESDTASVSRYSPTMLESNVELVYRAHDAFNRRDLDAFVALADPDVEITPLTVELEGVTSYHGHDGLRTWWTDLLAVFPDFHTQVDEVRALGTVTVGRARLRGHGIESDAFFERPIWQVVEWRDQKAVWWRAFLTEAEALEAAGERQ